MSSWFRSIRQTESEYSIGNPWSPGEAGMVSGSQHSKPPKGGYSGGVAIIVPKGLPIFRGPSEYSHRWIRASVPWTRTKSLQVFCVYGADKGHISALKENRILFKQISAELHALGRVPFALGGDWNNSPMDLLALWPDAPWACVPKEPTTDYGSTLDWFLLPKTLHGLSQTEVLQAPVPTHRPALLLICQPWTADLGWRILKPKPLAPSVEKRESFSYQGDPL